MKQITINNQTFYYQTFTESSEYGDHVYTEFWKETKPVTSKKYLFFGPKTTKDEPIVLFTIYNDTNNPRLTKDWWRIKIEHEIALLSRQEQLDKGELI